MSTIDTLIHLTGLYGPVALTTIAVFLFAEMLVLRLARRNRKQDSINKRLKLIEELDDRQAALEELRRYRGLTADGRQQLGLVRFNRLVTQSGAGVPPSQILVIMPVIFTSFLAALMISTGSLPLSLICAALAGIGFPLFVLRFMRNRRIAKFETQLPEAVDVMVRSLRAGHPVPVAVAMVGREMPDPVGTEFGIASDEMTYGLDLETAMVNLRERTGQGDLSFLVVATSIQSKTGGNLGEILGNLARLMRERFKMRRKIHAISTEGRSSAIGLTLVPILVFLALRLISPSYYNDIGNDPIVMPVAIATFLVWLTGVLVIRRMVNFKF